MDSYLKKGYVLSKLRALLNIAHAYKSWPRVDLINRLIERKTFTFFSVTNHVILFVYFSETHSVTRFVYFSPWHIVFHCVFISVKIYGYPVHFSPSVHTVPLSGGHQGFGRGPALPLTDSLTQPRQNICSKDITSDVIHRLYALAVLLQYFVSTVF